MMAHFAFLSRSIFFYTSTTLSPSRFRFQDCFLQAWAAPREEDDTFAWRNFVVQNHNCEPTDLLSLTYIVGTATAKVFMFSHPPLHQLTRDPPPFIIVAPAPLALSVSCARWSADSWT